MRKRSLLKGKGDASGDYTKAMNAALRLLSFRPRTAKELSGRLYKSGFDRDLVTRVCEKLKALSYIDDRQFAVSWIKAFSGPKCRNAWVLKRDLRKRGVPPELADEVIEEHFSKEEVFKAACNLARQRMSKAAVYDAERVKVRVQNMLLRRGFDHDFIREVMIEATNTKE